MRGVAVSGPVELCGHSPIAERTRWMGHPALWCVATIRKAAWLAMAALALPLWSAAQNTATPVFQAEYTNPGLTPSHWTLTIHPDGSGHFRSERGNAPRGEQMTVDPPNVDRDVRVSSEFADRVFQTARQHRLFGENCEGHLKVAFQGTKKLSYDGADGQGSCAFNFAKDKDVQALADSLVAVAGTIVEGGRLEVLLQHDPLGLDRETEYLVEAAGDGRAEQIGAIRAILERLADDENVMERVRRRVRVLLAMAEK